MRVLLRDQIDVGNAERRTYFNEKELTFFEQITVSIRMVLNNRKSVKRRLEEQEAKRNQQLSERIENLKTAILEQIRFSSSPEINKRLARANKKALAVTLSIDRSFADVIDEVLLQQEFDGYIVTRYKENEDVLQSCTNLPICVRFERRVI